MNRASKNYIPPVKMVSAGGVMLNMSTVKAIQVGVIATNYEESNTIIVTYTSGDSEELLVNMYPSSVIDSLMEQMR